MASFMDLINSRAKSSSPESVRIPASSPWATSAGFVPKKRGADANRCPYFKAEAVDRDAMVYPIQLQNTRVEPVLSIPECFNRTFMQKLFEILACPISACHSSSHPTNIKNPYQDQDEPRLDAPLVMHRIRAGASEEKRYYSGIRNDPSFPQPQSSIGTCEKCSGAHSIGD